MKKNPKINSACINGSPRGSILYKCYLDTKYNFNKPSQLYLQRKRGVGELGSFCFIESETDSPFNLTVVHVEQKKKKEKKKCY